LIADKQKVTSNHPQLDAVIQRICTGPELSKNISFAEARDAMRCIIDGDVSDVQAALFLIGLRIKRESDDEFKGVLQALRNSSNTAVANVDQLVVLSDPYNGFARHLPSSPFLPAVLAALGIATVSEGVSTVAPKYGVTHHSILKAAGKQVDQSVEVVARQLADPAIGWGYIDQAQYNPGLHALLPLRQLMVKRPVLATVEHLIGPIRGSQQTHLVAGFVHKAYPRIYGLLADFAEFDSTLLIRGIEGGISPSLRDPARIIIHRQGEQQTIPINPEQCQATQAIRATALPDSIDPRLNSMDAETNLTISTLAAEKGIEALQGQTGTMREALVYSGAVIFSNFQPECSLAAAACLVREVLDSSKAHTLFLAT
jgi:anthranilate phosphoribosyltransferase